MTADHPHGIDALSDALRLCRDELEKERQLSRFPNSWQKSRVNAINAANAALGDKEPEPLSDSRGLCDLHDWPDPYSGFSGSDHCRSWHPLTSGGSTPPP